jgi:hydrogenase expression/formation protein HypC
MCLGIPGQIVEISDVERKLALVSIGGIKRSVNIACILDEDQEPSSALGEWVLVHVGFAMARIDAIEAQKTLDLLNELGEARAEFEALATRDAAVRDVGTRDAATQDPVLPREGAA